MNLAPLVPPGHTFVSLERGTPHTVARIQRPEDYPERAPAPLSWEEVGADYQPPEFTHPKVLAGPEWAESQDFEAALAVRAQSRQSENLEELFPSYEPARFEQRRPLNPRGPTGLSGRGVLGRFGANFAADPLVFRTDRGRLEMIAIRRRDNQRWAIPGGMVDHAEQVSQTLARELAEEALGKEASPAQVRSWEEKFGRLFSQQGVEVYRGYVDDFRNTDHAWMETSAFYLLLRPEHSKELGWDLSLVAGDDATEARWMTLRKVELDNMHANHAEIVGRAVQILEQKEALQIASDGTIYQTP